MNYAVMATHHCNAAYDANKRKAAIILTRCPWTIDIEVLADSDAASASENAAKILKEISLSTAASDRL